EKSADRHVTDEMVRNGLAQALVELVDGRPQRDPALRLELELPVRRNLDAPALQHEKVAGRHLSDPPKQRAGRGDDPQRQVPVQCVRIELRERRVVGKQRLDLGREREPFAVMKVVQRLLSEVIPREQQAPPSEIVESESEHAAKTLERTGAVPL